MSDGRMARRAAVAAASGSRGAATRQRLREAAVEAFSELGWLGTRVQDIVVRAGVSHGTFYTYYRNKTVLLAELVRTSQAEIAALASEPWDATDVRGELERIIGGFLEQYERDAVVMRTWLQAARDEPAFGALYRDSRALFVERVAHNLQAVVLVSRSGVDLPAPTMASALVAMVEHFAYCWQVLGEPHEREEAIGSLLLVWGSTLNTLAGSDLVDLAGARRCGPG